MSGNFTERGELSMFDKYTRAECATLGGADLVIELPFPYCSLSAEGFARAGVHILASLGIKDISFGSECADKALLYK
jgi:predicted nucleotidyltransferase